MYFRLILLFLAFFFIQGCGEKKKKVYTQFDSVNVVTQIDSNLDESAKNGGPGFEKYGYSRNN